MEYDEDYDHELALAQRGVMEECMEYGDNLVRSVEEGWFYADVDGE